MKAFHDQRQRLHDPAFRLEDGKVVQNPDRPERIDALHAAAEAAGLEFHLPRDAGMEPLAAVHTPRYLHYLRTIHARRKAERPEIVEVVPGRFCRDASAFYSDSAEAQIGFHNADTSCPISVHTWDAVYWSAQCAVSAADEVLAGAQSSYALCRPSGHHAYAEISGGFCFVNNTAAAAQRLVRAGHRPAVLDIDVHHGNGTQAIFYERADVLTVSLHVDPQRFYPFYCGGAQEWGSGPGLGYNLNLPLPAGTGNDAYLRMLETALDRIGAFGASAIVLALGLDTHEGDPFRGMALTTDCYPRIAQRLKASGLPLVVVQEGGYMQPALGRNLQSFLEGLG